MRYVLKHSGVYSGKKTSTFHVLLPIQGNLWADELWDLLHCAQKRHYVKKHHFFFFFCGSSSYVCVLEAPPLLHMRKMSEQLGFLASPDASPSLCQKMQLTEWSPGTATPACINALWDPLTYTIHIHFSARFLWGSFLCLGTVLPLCLQPTPLFWW